MFFEGSSKISSENGFHPSDFFLFGKLSRYFYFFNEIFFLMQSLCWKESFAEKVLVVFPASSNKPIA